MLDTLCAWCDLDKTCVIRNVTKGESACVDQNSSKMLITDGSVCPVCSDHVECLTCAQVFDCLSQCHIQPNDYMVCIRSAVAQW